MSFRLISPFLFQTTARPSSKAAPRIIQQKENTTMPRKTQTKTEEIFSEDKVFKIHLANIVPSPFEPQSRRRAKFKEADLQSLGESIKRYKLKQPIVVRRIAPGKHEIVFGERRWLASRLAGLATIKCFVEDYTNAEVIELQYEENHRRQENDPLDDAFTFKFLIENENYSEEDLADRFAKSRREIVEKLRLNDLIEEAKEELTNGRLPLKHAYYLAKFPEATQKEILNLQLAYKYHDRDEKAVSFEIFKDEVEESIVRRLIDAPFDISDPRLHIKNLLCADCPDNSARATHLFPEFATEACCLNKTCFELKTNANLRIKREEIAASKPNPTNAPVEETVKEVPLVTERKYASERTPFREKVLVDQELLDEKECEFSELSLAVEGTKKGRQVWVCRNADCPIHHPKLVLNESEQRLAMEELERRVNQAVREKVLAKAIKALDDYKPFWMFDDLIQKLLVQLWYDCGWDTLKPILRIIRDWKNVPKSNDYDKLTEFISSLNKVQQSQLLFLFVFKTEGFYQNSSQDGIKKLAEDYTKINYQLLAAETRLELAATPEEKELATDILTVTRSEIGRRQNAEIDFTTGDNSRVIG